MTEILRQSAASKTYVCRHCRLALLRPSRRCPACGKAGTVFARTTMLESAPKADLEVEPNEVPSDPLDAPRIATGSAEFDRVLGGGAVPGFVYLLAGPPGIGKSTLMAAAAAHAAREAPVYYGTAEELEKQVDDRFLRLGLEENSMADDHLTLAEGNNVQAMTAEIVQIRPRLVVFDSVSTMIAPGCDSEPGGGLQTKAVARHAASVAHMTGAAVFLIGHFTKNDQVAGPRALEHLVDCVLEFTAESNDLRVLRASKNRGGSTTEIGVFEMGPRGLSDVADPSAMTLVERPVGVAGSAIAALMPEGVGRAVLVEVQALVGGIKARSTGKRTVVGVSASRVQTICAVIEHVMPTTRIGRRDVHLNVIGGLLATETASDAAIALSIVSAVRRRPVLPGTVVFGEIGLTGEMRSCGQPLARVIESAKSGLGRVILPSLNFERLNVEDLPERVAVQGVGTLLDLVRAGLGKRPR